MVVFSVRVRRESKLRRSWRARGPSWHWTIPLRPLLQLTSPQGRTLRRSCLHGFSKWGTLHPRLNSSMSRRILDSTALFASPTVHCIKFEHPLFTVTSFLWNDFFDPTSGHLRACRWAHLICRALVRRKQTRRTTHSNRRTKHSSV